AVRTRRDGDMMNPMEPLETRLKRQAQALGFELVGVAPATAADGFDRLRAWLGRGFAGTMDYMHRHAEARREPSSILPEVRSVVMVGMNYFAGERRAGRVNAPGEGRRADTRRSPAHRGIDAPRPPVG